MTKADEIVGLFKSIQCNKYLREQVSPQGDTKTLDSMNAGLHKIQRLLMYKNAVIKKNILSDIKQVDEDIAKLTGKTQTIDSENAIREKEYKIHNSRMEMAYLVMAIVLLALLIMTVWAMGWVHLRPFQFKQKI